MSDPVSLPIPLHLVREARLYAKPGSDLDAVCYVLQDYPNLVADLRRLRARVHQLDDEALQFDDRLARLQDACRMILDL
ncbi:MULTISPECIES: hypothetical protein [unclassified Pseudomonas]|uniref:hypothetical protein n=1 Tax=unclassified Pseudomonas TaxID=196821 RepID=UPI000DA93053|nr:MULTISPECIES: hypothetical protein [unclassified Pseudomonas]MDW3713288.1 hypothetical protein [Pseudomonas sp. 2023EL-01195]PZE12005.1 hypothetical protein DMX10_18145 [Pseudomonas sp. 57B-090624]